MPNAGCGQNALGSREHGDRRRYETVAIEQGCAAHAENENETGPASDDMLGQGHQGKRSALTLVVGPQDKETYFTVTIRVRAQKTSETNPRTAGSAAHRGMGQCLAHGIERARADVAEHDAHGSHRERPQAVGSVSDLLTLVTGRSGRQFACHFIYTTSSKSGSDSEPGMGCALEAPGHPKCLLLNE